jgi:hypothetical protein
MDGDTDTAARYRQRAEEVRAIAEGIRDEKSRAILVRVAEDYERMARQWDAARETDRKLAARKNL